ncbi:MAG: NgoFVII family restriction endonuclease [Caldilineaceae bacterium SB0662_bin_9]|uniref:NgoFVII family restriction endonuclease n=1 Tax=Caldilineaceae bacterium SB0662_bin_9 TaxID=2605258 RepID=A0A6B1DSP5_9CHLR|nr:NgoFVII family restriction endonuclease [Caldilineaceae bacterium SB0662_bin_9]
MADQSEQNTFGDDFLMFLAGGCTVLGGVVGLWLALAYGSQEEILRQFVNDYVVDRLIDYLVWSAPLIGMLLGSAVAIIVAMAWKFGWRACKWLTRRFAATPAVPGRKRPATPSPLRDNLVDGNKVVAHLDAVLDKGLRLDVCVAYPSVEGLGRLAQWIDGMDPNGRARLLVGSMPRNWTPLHPSARAAGHFMAKHLDYDKQAIPVLERLAGHQEAERLELCVRLAVPQLHAKLYAWIDAQGREGALIGSSNLTKAGLNDQGELNVVVGGDDVQLHAHAWFEARWNEQAAYPADFSDALSALHESSSM